MSDPVLLPQPRHLETGDGSIESVDVESVEVATASGMRPEGYRLAIDDGGVHAEAADPVGAAHARRTLAQLRRVDGRWPQVRIDDHPDLAVRGAMLDVSRDKVPTMATLLALVDQLASWKYNHLQLYVEHTFTHRGPRGGVARRLAVHARRDRDHRPVLPRSSHRARAEPEPPRPHGALPRPPGVPADGHRSRRLPVARVPATPAVHTRPATRRRVRAGVGPRRRLGRRPPRREAVPHRPRRAVGAHRRPVARLRGVAGAAAGAARARGSRRAGVGRHPRRPPRADGGGARGGHGL